jgi:hypothetical protein
MLTSLRHPSMVLFTLLCFGVSGMAKDATVKSEAPTAKQPEVNSKKTEPSSPLMIQEDFKSGLEKWKLSINDTASRDKLSEDLIKERVTIVPAPDSPPGSMAVRMTVPHALGTFRSEISQPYEKGFHERWYGLRIYVPKDWNFKAGAGDDIVMQWHAILGDDLKSLKDAKGEEAIPNFPVLSIAIEDDKWEIRRAFGDPAKSGRDMKKLDEPVAAGRWTAWVIHARWSSGDDGLIEIWKDGKLVKEAKGPNNYLVAAHTPYFKTGIYHPTWKTKNAENFAKQEQGLKARVIYAADIKLGNEKAKYEDVAPVGR